jgi:Leu/Phe-tRNA-protein transferase
VGLGRGAVFSADTMFHRESGASRIALVDLVSRLNPSRAVDLQWDSPHTRRLGASLMARRDYLALVASGVDRIGLPTDRRAVDSLLGHPPDPAAGPPNQACATEVEGR